MSAASAAAPSGSVWVDKAQLRRGELPPSSRRDVWLAAAQAGMAAGRATLPSASAGLPAPTAAAAAASAYYYRAALHEVFGASTPAPARLFRIPFLGVEPSVLPEEVRARRCAAGGGGTRPRAPRPFASTPRIRRLRCSRSRRLRRARRTTG